jgi:prevent-host-death family protein
MKKMAAGAFKANCLAVMDDVQAKHETVVITKYGKPVAKLVPVEPQGDDIFGFLRGRVTITGDVVSPTLSRREWGNLK